MHGFFDRLARLFARLGGYVLTVLIVLTCLSILGRSLSTILNSDIVQSLVPGWAAMILDWGIGPIKGDFELVEAGMAFAIFAFLPLCQLNGAHAAVDIFTSTLSSRANRLLRAIIEVIFAGVLVLIAVQLFEGMQSKRNSGQTTLYLEFPIWWAYAFSLVAAVAAAIVSIYMALMRVVESATGRIVLPPNLEADH
ncbi:MAG: TRAP transporter small permease [Pelagimonas sp.]|jgi:TRAP-type C4-dicarboxylate transport system permease small subunit|nr:TRAP transporter small permease [Pelagimonas sp.]